MIIVPEHLFTEAVFYTDMNANDFEIEIDFMMRRNQAIQNFYLKLVGGTLTKGDMDEFGDILNHYWIDPYAWIESVEQQFL